jgi:putative FmdB family regulatory protein
MPTYRYRCNICGEFDYVQSMRDTNLAYCPTCMGGVEKVFSSAPIIFNGSGFYSTERNKIK